MLDYFKENVDKVVSRTIGLGLIVLVLFTLLYLRFLEFNFLVDPDLISKFGNFIGGFIGTIFAFATILLVWMSYETQKKELKETKKVLGLQQFESTFFDLLKTQRSIKESITFDTTKRLTSLESQKRTEGKLISGEEFFEFAQKDFTQFYNADESISPKIIVHLSDEQFVRELMSEGDQSKISKLNPEKRIKYIYKDFFDRYHNYIGHYFRHTFHILNYLCKRLVSEFESAEGYNEKSKKIKRYQFYADILQSQMSSSELFLMFYNGICFPKTRRLIERFKLLENLSKEDLADSYKHPELYKKFKFKSRRDILEEVQS